MFNLKKIGSLALAGTMALSSMMISAGAVDVNEEAASEPQALSEYAGETMAVNVVRVSEDGTTVQKTIEVDIPEGATNAEQKTVVAAAANSAAGYAMTRANMSDFGTPLCTNEKVAYLSPSGSTASTTILNNGIASVNYSTLTVYMRNISRAISGINVNVWTNSISSSGNGKVYIANTPVSDESTCMVIFYDGYTAPSGDRFWITAGDSVYAYGSTTGGSGRVTTQLYGR